MADTNATEELAALFEAEYGDLTDIVMRALGITLGGALLYIYTGWAASYVWGILFAAVHLVQWSFLRTRRETATHRDAIIGGLLFVLVHVAFIWMPTHIASGEDPALMLVGLLVFVVTAMYHIRRADTALWLVDAQIIVFTLSLVYISTQHLLRLDTAILKVGVTMVTAMAVIYIAITMRVTHRKQIEILGSSERLAQEQKLSAIGRLAGGVAHDFNNILTVIKGNLELHDLLDNATEKAAVLREAHLAAERAEGVVQQLLIYARKAPSNKMRVDANALLEDVALLGKRLLPAHIHLTCTGHARPLMVELDEKRLVAALLNLITNAIDAIPASGSITLRAAEVAFDRSPPLVSGRALPGGRYAEIRATDTGNGIPHEIIARVTDPFFTTKDPGKGTGLGLSMVLGFVEELAGGMAIESTPAGTEITLLLPLKD